MNTALEELVSGLRRRYGASSQIGRSNVFKFRSGFVCSINYSKLLAGHKFFFGVPKALLDLSSSGLGPAENAYILLICGAPDNVLVIPQALAAGMLEDVPSRRVDVFVEGGMYILQTTKHPKLDVTDYLNAYPKNAASEESAGDEAPSANAVLRPHTRIQHSLIRLGRAEGCSVWVPQNDRGLSQDGERFTGLTVDRLPRFGFDEYTRRIVQNIDVLWLADNVIHKAFEIESTTEIYSGLLRLNDLVLAQPNIQIELFIAAPDRRKQRVFEQLTRPSFRKLVKGCRFLGFEEIDDARHRLGALVGSEGTRVSGLVQGEEFAIPDHVVYPLDLR